MNKITVHMSLSLIIILILSVFPCSTKAFAAAFEMEIGMACGYAGETVTVPIEFNNVPAAGVNSCDFVISYSTSVLEVIDGGVKAGPICKNSSETFDSNIDAKSGTIKFLYSDETGLGTEAITSDGVFATISFLIKKTTPISSFKIKTTGEPVFGNAGLEYIETGIVDGSVEVVEKQGYKVSGYILPDLTSDNQSDTVLKSGFYVEIPDINKSTVTDQNGYFELYTDNNLSSLDLFVSKDGFLCREIKNLSLNNSSGYIEVSSESTPIAMWIGDINKDNAINMADIMEISTAFNSSRDSSRYKSEYDVNKDDAVNMSDIMAIVQHFNKVPDDYK